MKHELLVIVSVRPHVCDMREYTLVTCHTQCVCCECKNVFANDVSVKLYCLPITDVCL